MRYLEQLSKNLKVKGLVFVAGWFNLLEETFRNDEERETMKPWLETPIDYGKVNRFTDNVLAVFSNNDPYVPVSDSELFKERLGAKIIIKESEGHFNEVQEIKEIMEFIG